MIFIMILIVLPVLNYSMDHQNNEKKADSLKGEKQCSIIVEHMIEQKLQESESIAPNAAIEHAPSSLSISERFKQISAQYPHDSSDDDDSDLEFMFPMLEMAGLHKE